jgi:hypothetical protein
MEGLQAFTKEPRPPAHTPAPHFETTSPYACDTGATAPRGPATGVTTDYSYNDATSCSRPQEARSPMAGRRLRLTASSPPVYGGAGAVSNGVSRCVSAPLSA